MPSSASGTTPQRTPDTEITITGSASSPSDGKPAAGTRAGSATALTQPSRSAPIQSNKEQGRRRVLHTLIMRNVYAAAAQPECGKHSSCWCPALYKTLLLQHGQPRLSLRAHH